MRLSHALAFVLSIGTASLALAHAPKVGANGGAQTDAGGFHVEVVPQGAVLRVYLRDHADQPVATAGYKGTAIFVIGGKPQRIPLTPAGDNKLTGTSAVPLPNAPKGAVQIIPPSGSSVQAKFN